MRFLTLFAITLLFILVLSKKYEFEFDDEEVVQEKTRPELHGATLMNRGFDFRQGGQGKIKKIKPSSTTSKIRNL
jgi:hypothetical protein